MGKKEDRELKRLENALFSLEEAELPKAKPRRVYNADRADVDLADYSQAVEAPKKRGWFGKFLILLLLLALACWLYRTGGLGLWS